MILVLILALLSVSARAFDDEPTIGDIIGEQMIKALQARQEAVVNKKLFEKEIQDARERFWKCHQSPKLIVKSLK